MHCICTCISYLLCNFTIFFRQTSLTLDCLQFKLETCSGIQRYFLARLSDEILLTSDLLCEQRSCKIQIAEMCMADAIKTLNVPVVLVMSSEIICRYFPREGIKRFLRVKRKTCSTVCG